MSFSLARGVCDMALRDALEEGRPSCCVSFYGGEPLLERNLIERVVSYAQRIFTGSGVDLHFHMTTNGALLDEPFARYARDNRFQLALSIDGTREAHDLHRKDGYGAPTFERVLSAARTVLAELPNTPAMVTVCPDTAPLLRDSVWFLHGLGFRSIVTTPDFTADWTEEQISALARQYEALADWYANRLLAGDAIQLPIFDNKFVNHLAPIIDREKCVPGQSRLSITPDGSIYPCTQFVKYSELCIGDVDFVDGERLSQVRELACQVMPECAGCALIDRCDNRCGCKCLASTGCVNRVSPAVCAHERALIPIADRLGERIFA